jgi:hypothetical protein
VSGCVKIENNIGNNLLLWAHHPVEGKIHQILPVDLSQGDAIPSGTLATSMALVNKLTNSFITGDHVRQLPLLPKLLQHWSPQVTSIFP